MTLDEAKNLLPGTLVRWSPKNRASPIGYTVKAGATAKVIGPHNFYTDLIVVEWIRDDLSSTQQNGGYLIEDFEQISSTLPSITTRPCSCSAFDFARWGCRYLTKTDPQGFLHL